MVASSGTVSLFLSTLSLRRATPALARSVAFDTFLSTLSLRRATFVVALFDARKYISIHALLAESDGSCAVVPATVLYFYPRSPCGERPLVSRPVPPKNQFLSTLSLRRATLQWSKLWPSRLHFYPRSPCGERPGRGQGLCGRSAISIHALLAESDAYFHKKQLPSRLISIHALLAESDACCASLPCCKPTFLSTLSLRRATAWALRFDARLTRFLSTLSLRRATKPCRVTASSHHNFYPRSPCGERQLLPIWSARTTYFYPRSPCGERQPTGGHPIHPTQFLSTLSLRRAT